MPVGVGEEHAAVLPLDEDFSAGNALSIVEFDQWSIPREAHAGPTQATWYAPVSR